MARTEYTVSAPGFIADPASVAKNPGRQVNWDAVPASSDYQDENDNKRLKSGTIVSYKNGGIFPRTEAEMAVASITRYETTATVTTTPDHGLKTGDTITISGADQSDYNITATVTVTGDKTFTYQVSGSPATPATGTVLATSPAVGILATSANKASKTDSKTGYGVLVGGVIYETLLADADDADIEAFKAELQTNGAGFVFESHTNDAAS